MNGNILETKEKTNYTYILSVVYKEYLNHIDPNSYIVIETIPFINFKNIQGCYLSFLLSKDGKIFATLYCDKITNKDSYGCYTIFEYQTDILPVFKNTNGIIDEKTFSKQIETEIINIINIIKKQSFAKESNKLCNHEKIEFCSFAEEFKNCKDITTQWNECFCLICYEKTNSVIACCEKFICVLCLSNVKNMTCPHCRKNHGKEFHQLDSFLVKFY